MIIRKMAMMPTMVWSSSAIVVRTQLFYHTEGMARSNE